jgi:class 3 adenylate cyclase/predicted ATPase
VHPNSRRARLSVHRIGDTTRAGYDFRYFVGARDDLTTDLSRISGSFVIARNTALTYKGKSVDVKQVGRELGVLEGSVRRARDKVRVNVQLVDAETGAHFWAERFDGSPGAVFALEDQITIGVCGAIERALQPEELHRSTNSVEQATGRDSRPLDPTLAERRPLTVMSCNLIDSAALASRLDPEDLRDLIAAYHRAVAEIVTQFEGFVAKHLGDGVLIYFGYPRGHEDDAERAIRCALTVADTLMHLRLGEALRTSVGIATSMVVVGGLIDGDGSLERNVVGEALSLAVRLRDFAAPNSVVIADSTRRLVGQLFEYRAVGVTGVTNRVPAWQVLRPSVFESRFEALRGPALTGLVGRDEEIDLLLRRWDRAKTGDGQIVLLSGEPGLGKSRLAVELEERLQVEAHIRLRYFCSPYHEDSALYPFADQLRRAAGIGRDEPATAKLEKIEALLTRATPPDQDLAFLADLLSLPASTRYPLPNLSPQRKKERILEALLRQLEGLARAQPVVTIFEDAHWIDPTSRELLDLAIERVRSLPVLLIVTFRPEFQPPWTGQRQVTMLVLNRLGRRDRTTLVEQIAGGKTLPDEVVNRIADRTDGVPLFVEELTKSVLESGVLREEADRYVLDGSLPPFAIPTSLHASLIARLDRLSSVRSVAQVGAAIGREFPYELVRAVSPLPENELRASLARLVASGLVFQRGAPPDAVYSFKHALVQDAAHSSLLRNARQQLHGQIADALETHSPEVMESHPEIFAQHYSEAGLVEKSAAWWGKAGRRSAARSAMAEARAQLLKGLDQLALLADSSERRLLELELRSALGAVLNAVEGVASPETGHAYARARELWEQLGSPSDYLQVPFGQSLHHAFRGELDLAQRLDEDFLLLSRRRNDTAGLVLGHLACGRNRFIGGRLLSSRSHLEQVVVLYDPVSHRSLAHRIGIPPREASLAYLGFVLFCAGFPDQALAQSNAAIAEARRLAHPPSLATILANSTAPLWLVGDDAALDKRVDELVAVANEHDLPLFRAVGAICRGWLKVKNGDVAEGLSLLRRGLAGYRGAGFEVFVPYNISFLAEACETAGQFEEALTLIDEALRIVERTGERWFEAELYRRKGRLLLRQGHPVAPEELYRKALSIAVKQEAKLWELRAAVSLARLRRDQGRRVEARGLLAPAYAWFTEGFDTPDLKDAKALLETLDA